MLSRLFVQNFALIERTELHLAPGLNILTGETGAGKSLLVGAIGLVRGNRADPNVVLNPAENCIVEAEFTVPDRDRLLPALAEHEVELAPDDPLIVRRMIAPSGKSRAFLNDQPVTLNALRDVCQWVVELHGQHEGTLLLDPRRQLDILDRYASHEAAVAEFGRQLARARKLVNEIDDLRARETEATRQLDYFTHQLNELQKANISPEEEATLEAEAHVLENAEQIQLVLAEVLARLTEYEPNLVGSLAQTERRLAQAVNLFNKAAPELDKLEQARYLLKDAAEELRTMAESVEHDPAKLAHVQARLDLYNRLKMKFAVRDVAGLLRLQAEFEAKVSEYSSIEERIVALERDRQALLASLLALGLQLEATRRLAGADLAARVEAALHKVGLPNARFQAQVERTWAAGGILPLDGRSLNPNATGFNAITFLISTNAGHAPGPLTRVASGGEISRVMLAIKTALAARMQLQTLVFDEIDAGISGEVGMKVGRVMQELATSHQIISITHLPQIASRPSRHFKIYKEVLNGATVSRVRELTPEARMEELAMMMSGANPSPAALASAKELLAAI